MTQERLHFVPTPATSRIRPRSRWQTWTDSLRAHRRAWLALRGFREIILICAVYAFYDITRYFVSGDHDVAVRHGASLLSFEQRLHIAPEHWLNNLFSAHLMLGVPADYIYATLHYLVTPAVLIWMWRRHSGEYADARTVLVATTVVGLVCFSLLPIAPPRLLPGFIDTMAHYSHYGWWGNAASAPRGFGHDTNQYAAMPSLHVGWAIWCGWLLYRYGKHRLTRIAGVAYPIVLSVVVIATANHYLLDVVAGLVAVLVGMLVARLFNRVGWWTRQGPPTPAMTPPPPRVSISPPGS
jgi:hypothetical protein